jgi:hypothetical protein
MGLKQTTMKLQELPDPPITRTITWDNYYHFSAKDAEELELKIIRLSTSSTYVCDCGRCGNVKFPAIIQPVVKQGIIGLKLLGYGLRTAAQEEMQTGKKFILADGISAARKRGKP